MPIDLFDDGELLTMKEAAELCPSRRGGRKVCYETVRRWCTTGIRGQKLESVIFGGARMTTAQAIERFVRALSKPEGTVVENRAAMRAADLAALAELRAYGIGSPDPGDPPLRPRRPRGRQFE